MNNDNCGLRTYNFYFILFVFKQNYSRVSRMNCRKTLTLKSARKSRVRRFIKVRIFFFFENDLRMPVEF